MDVSDLAEKITESSSYQTAQTIRLLVDKPLVSDCFKAYAYFRWVDNEVDDHLKEKDQRIAFIKRQKQIIEDSYQGKELNKLNREEYLVYHLIRRDKRNNPKLRSYIENFHKIIEFDAYRKGVLINQKELRWYTDTLAKAVTDCIYYFIGNDYKYKSSDNQYNAASAACIIHMLRDLREDIPEGYINIPKEYLYKYDLKPTDFEKAAYRNWVKSQVTEARRLMYKGKQYIADLKVLRCKIAANWYCERFEPLLDTIEQDDYLLRPSYRKNRGVSSKAKFLTITGDIIFKHFFIN